MTAGAPLPGLAPVPRARRNLDAAITLLFAVAVTAPALVSISDPVRALASVRIENRIPAPAPTLPDSPRAAAKWPRAFRAWHDDRLGFRGLLLEARSRLILDGLGASPTPTAVVDGRSWLWYAGESSMHAWRGASPLRPDHVEDWVRVYRDRAAWCAARGITYVAGLTPNKMEVYPERLPPPYEKIGPSRYDQINTALAVAAHPWYVDLRAEILEAKREDGESDFTYSRRGTHWTGRAALRGVMALIERARAAGVPVESLTREHFVFEPRAFDDDNWTGQLHLRDMAFEVQPVFVRNLARRWRPTGPMDGTPRRVEAQTEQDDLPRLWLSHDSFGALLRLYLGPFFSRSVFDWNFLGEFDARAMIEHAPHLVLDVHTERMIFQRPPDFTASIDAAQRATRFEGAGEPVWTLAHSVDRVIASPALEVEREGDGLSLTVHGPGAAVDFPDADLSGPRTPIVRLVIEAPRAGRLHLEHHVQDRSGWRSASGRGAPYESGAQTLHFEILDARARGPLRLGLEDGSGTVRILSAEIRSAGW